MSYPVAQISIAMFSVFLGVSTWYLTQDALPAFVSIITASLMIASYVYFFASNRFKLKVNVNPEQDMVLGKKKRK